VAASKIGERLAGGPAVIEVDRHQRPGEARILAAGDAANMVAGIGEPL
jgi:hypothetical protein